jgi:hypothetical protein
MDLERVTEIEAEARRRLDEGGYPDLEEMQLALDQLVADRTNGENPVESVRRLVALLGR